MQCLARIKSCLNYDGIGRHTRVTREELKHGLRNNKRKKNNAIASFITLHTVTFFLPRHKSTTGIKKSIVTNWANV
jgi:hypothetical protein